MRSKHKGDIYRWLIKVMDSCNNIEQLRGCLQLILNFKKTHEDYVMDYYLTRYYENNYKKLKLRENDIKNYNLEQKSKGYKPMNFDL